ncbi:IclR family transcriptional regulator [Cryobacterium psychrophilum]|uniref:IclR family transcriptional regulator n=1 Tax=Cryobacterium psychrophilum TaxID=41988 RepID=A0A4Y8KKV7_9MICO|nr:IclR family transcriptional regulator [Cryobacterium psychrophilum]TDW26922.1 IclR family transcriptional regulator [Cryobacterium psychrophilum]TFD75329.1 IclR family transcriptional regulator [Cryobacterium psychrophilum]
MTSIEDSPQTVDPRRNSAGLRRDLELLEVLASATADGLGVLQVADLVGRDKGMVSRALATLAESALVSRDPITRNYRLGYRLYSLAARTFESHLVHVATPYLRQLEMATRETTHLCVLRGGNVLTLASEESDHDIRGRSWKGLTTAAWQTPSGRVLLSDWAEDELHQWYEIHGHDPAIITPTSPNMVMAESALMDEKNRVVTDFDSLKTEIDRIRKQGYATIDEEFESGVVAVSAPIYDSQHRIIAAINVSAPKPRFGARLNGAGTITARIAAEISAAIGTNARDS